MQPLVVLLGPAVLLVTGFSRGILARRRAERRAATADALALAARRAVPLHVPLERAAFVAPARRAAALRAVASDLKAGHPLAETLRNRLPREFPSAVAESLGAGERASRLPAALDAVAAEATRDLARGHRMALAAFYPALLFVCVALLNLLVLDGRLSLLDDATTPGETAGAALWPVAVVRWAILGIAGCVAGVLALRRLRRPVSGAAAARFLRTTSLLLASGRPAHAALAGASTSAGVPRLARAATAAAKRVEAGEPVESAWRSLPIPRAARARLVSASTTGLPSLLNEVAAACDARDARRADRFIRWSVPVATAAAGLLVVADYAVLAELWARTQEMARPW